MKKIFAMLAVAASLLAVSCGKDDNKGGSTKTGGDVDTSLPASLQGSSYFPLLIDEESAEAIKDKIACDLRIDDVTKHLYIWAAGETYSAGEAPGTNFYGKTGYTHLICAATGKEGGWSGAGFNIGAGTADVDKFAEIAANPDKYYFHMGYKGKAGEAHLIHVYGLDGTDYAFAVGEGSVNIDGVAHSAIAPTDGAFEAGEWVEYEFSIQQMGLNYGGTFPAGGFNFVTFLSGNNPGAEIALDAIFIYKK